MTALDVALAAIRAQRIPGLVEKSSQEHNAQGFCQRCWDFAGLLYRTGGYESQRAAYDVVIAGYKVVTDVAHADTALARREAKPRKSRRNRTTRRSERKLKR